MEAAAGYAHLLLRTAGGGLYACESGDDGYAGRLHQPPPPNSHGQLGRPGPLPMEEALRPHRLPSAAFGGRRTVGVAAGRCASFAIDDAGVLHSWGCAQVRSLRPNPNPYLTLTLT